MDSEPLTFPIAVSKLALWMLGGMMTLLGGLLTWLCISTMNLREQNTILLERSGQAIEQYKIIHTELERLTQTDVVLRDKIEKLQLAQAEHGWKRAEGGL